MLSSAYLVFFMQAGFAMLCAGSVRSKNTKNILIKNVLDACVGALAWFYFGYGFALGKASNGKLNSFIGSGNFAMKGVSGNTDIAMYLFQWSFSAAATTIVSGSVAERTKFEAYLGYSFFLCAFVYPVVVHWGWSGQGWLGPWRCQGSSNGCGALLSGTGMLDFAGSGIVHMTGGIAGLVGAIIVGPRTGRFIDGKLQSMPGHSVTNQALGTIILWFGWYGFNCGSTLGLSGGLGAVAGKVAITTTLSATSSCLTSTVLSLIFDRAFDIGIALNGILAGLVGITANCSIVDPWHAVVIGLVSAIVYYGARRLLFVLKIDDPLDAFPIHGAAGFWGLLASGIFCTDANVQFAGYPNVNTACASGEQFAVQLIGGLVIFVWSFVMSGAVFLALKLTIGLRVTSEVELAGLDVSEHGLAFFADPAKPPAADALPAVAVAANKVAPEAP